MRRNRINRNRLLNMTEKNITINLALIKNIKTVFLKGIFLELIERANENGQLKVSVRSLAKDIGISYQTMRTAIANLAAGAVINAETNATINAAINARKTVITICSYCNYNIPKQKTNATINAETNATINAKEIKRNALLSRKESFYQSLIPFAEKYPKEMISAFFDYWSEMNKSQTKMRFEQQPTWEVAKRLATWAKRDKTYENNRRNYTSKQAANDYAMQQYLLERERVAQGVHDETPKPF